MLWEGDKANKLLLYRLGKEKEESQIQVIKNAKTQVKFKIVEEFMRFYPEVDIIENIETTKRQAAIQDNFAYNVAIKIFSETLARRIEEVLPQ